MYIAAKLHGAAVADPALRTTKEVLMLRSPTLLGLALVLVGCSQQGDETRSMTATVDVVDSDGDGSLDGVDLDGDGEADIVFGEGLCDHPALDADDDGRPDGLDFDCDGVAEIAWCEEPLIDADGDGAPDGIDLDCDGESDLDLGAAPPVPPDHPEPPDLPDEAGSHGPP
jgi:hypothetical protein